LTAPNDNSLPQLRWISRVDSGFDFDPFAFNMVVNPFEAYALEYFNQSRWKESYLTCIRWLLDTPYSVTPAAMGSYLAICILYAYHEGITICQVGLKANAREPVLLNNLVYAYCLTNRVSDAERYIVQIDNLDWTKLPQEHVIMLSATLGLYFMRKGEIAKGKDYYQTALALSKKLSIPYYRYMVTIHFTRELFVAKDEAKYVFKSQMDELKIDQKYSDCIFIRNEVQKFIDQASV
jgi:hypothetical protein